MDSTTSVSKGIFVFRNGFKKTKSRRITPTKFIEKIFEKEQWYTTYLKNWDVIENNLKDLHHNTYNLLLNDIVNYIKDPHTNNDLFMQNEIVPSVTILTGVCQPDHVSQFTTLIDLIIENVTPHVAMVNSQDAPTLKHLVENTVWQFINGPKALETSVDSDDEIVVQNPKLRKSQCTMRELKKWYISNNSGVSLKNNQNTSTRPLVIIIPDFESFSCNVLQDFVMIISSQIATLPIVLVFGVATSVSALHKSFPYHVSSKLHLKVFSSHSSPVYMNHVLENIFLTHTSPFHMSGKALELLTDVFFFYDFSVTGLIQSIKYCMLNHYYGDNLKTLCCERQDLEENILALSTDDIEQLRQMLSFRPFLEKQNYITKIKLFEDDIFFINVLYKKINDLYDYLYSFHLCVRLLLAFVKDLPKQMLGRSVREIYTQCASQLITETPAFKDCLQFISFQSQVKLVESIKYALQIVNSYLEVQSPIKPLQSMSRKPKLKNLDFNCLGVDFVKNTRILLLTFLRQIENANTERELKVDIKSRDCSPNNAPQNRYTLKEKLLKATKVDKIQSEFEMIQSRFVSYLEEIFSKGLQPPHTQTFNEILFFSDVANVRKQILGSPRGALHMALSNPAHYLKCSCCQLTTSESLVDTLPDICLAYKLHRECGKHINLYDWLQAFSAIIKPDCDDEQRHQDPVIQSRFSRAVAELQFLGFIKSSNRKTDHVIRLTW